MAGYPFTSWQMAVEYLRFFAAILAVTLPLWLLAALYRRLGLRYS